MRTITTILVFLFTLGAYAQDSGTTKVKSPDSTSVEESVIITWHGLRGGKISRKKTKYAKPIIARVGKIVEFELHTKIRGKLVVMSTSGNTCSDRMLGMIRSLKSGAKFSFENIKLRGADRVTRKVGSLKFEVE